MQCTPCGFENPSGTAFCGGCGAALGVTCASCGGVSPPGFRFCGHCGAPLPAETIAAPRLFPQEAAVASDGERRQLTVMFCDLAGSTSLSARMDPEEWRAVVREYQAACAGSIEAEDGYVAQYLGDGVLAYFGYPRGSEREASRAVRAGLGVVRGVEEVEARRGIGLAVRVGIHTGVVVIGEMGAGRRRDQLALGETPNLAARLQALADPDTVLVSGDTHRLLRDEFECEALGRRELAGIPAPVAVFRVTRDVSAEGGARRSGPAAPIVGRELEMAFLHGRWERVRAGEGQVVLVSGDAGMGKSALMHAFAASVGEEAAILETRCLPYFRSTAYQPAVDLLRLSLRTDAGAPPAERLRALSELLERIGLADEGLLPVFASLLSLPHAGAAEEAARPPRERKERTRAGLLRLLLAGARNGPLLLCVEDLHWADPSTLELLGLLADELAGRPILALFTHRLDFLPPWGHPAHQSQLALTRLPDGDVDAIVERLTGGRALPDAVREQILARTDGVPLFVEELTRTVLESGLLRDGPGGWELPGGSLPPLAIPATLHDSLEARLDRLATTKELAQLGAVLGREFDYALMHAVSDVAEGELREALAQLVSAELLSRRGVPPDAVYTFRHALIQEAAYQSLLKGVRQGWHQRAALALEERFPDQADAHPERVAQHYTAAGLALPAVNAWIRAGRRALERSANAEAVAHLRQALELLGEVAEGPERDAWELSVLLPLGPALTATLGYAAAEVRATYLRALELSRALRVLDDHLEVMGGLFASYFARWEATEALELGCEMLVLAAAEGDSPWEGAAHVAIGVALLRAGTLDDSRDHLEKALELYDPGRHFALAHSMGHDFGVVAWSYSAVAHFALGMPGEAVERAGRAAELARGLAHPHSLAMALGMGASLHFFRRDPAAVLEALDELEELTAREGFPHWGIDAAPMRAWALAAGGRVEEAMEAAAPIDVARLMRGGGTGPWLYRGWVVAEAYLAAGETGVAVPLLERLGEILEVEAPEMWWLADVHRAHAAALTRLGRPDDARAALERAADAARATGTPILLLRALLDLARVCGSLDAAVLTELRETVAALGGAGDLAEVAEARWLLAEDAVTAGDRG
ncbi:MAG TPA: adenylate/guanylate cyclase domain-containing protein [Longimicrobium sp.]|nr:adenylate/guanylate cyclase domain-containing protein [Longimicrobium sp.]